VVAAAVAAVIHLVLLEQEVLAVEVQEALVAAAQA
jgi:hypothetical protein